MCMCVRRSSSHLPLAMLEPSNRSGAPTLSTLASHFVSCASLLRWKSEADTMVFHVGKA